MATPPPRGTDDLKGRSFLVRDSRVNVGSGSLRRKTKAVRGQPSLRCVDSQAFGESHSVFMAFKDADFGPFLEVIASKV